MREEIVSFLREPGREYPFFIEMTGVSYCDGGYRIERRDSPIYVLEYILKGRGTVTTGGRSFTAEAGDVYLLHRGSDHRYVSDGRDPWVKVWLNLDGPLVDGLVWAYGLTAVNHIRGLDLRAPIEGIYGMARAHAWPDDELFRRASLLFHEAALAMHRRLNCDGTPVSAEAEAMKRYLDGRLHQKVRVEELGGLIYRSPSQAIRLFRREYGVTPYDYLLQKRMETAKLLLRNTSLQLKEIATRLAFADEHYFSNSFKARVGVSPARFRQGIES